MFYVWLLGKSKPKKSEEIAKPLKVINKYRAEDCCCGDEKQVLECQMIHYLQHPLRTGEE